MHGAPARIPSQQHRMSQSTCSIDSCCGALGQDLALWTPALPRPGCFCRGRPCHFQSTVLPAVPRVLAPAVSGTDPRKHLEELGRERTRTAGTLWVWCRAGFARRRALVPSQHSMGETPFPGLPLPPPPPRAPPSPTARCPAHLGPGVYAQPGATKARLPTCQDGGTVKVHVPASPGPEGTQT